MEDRPMHSGDSNLPRSLTDSDFQALSLEVAQARADARSDFLHRAGEAPLQGDQQEVSQQGGCQNDEFQAELQPEAQEQRERQLLEVIQQRLPSEDFAPVHCNLSVAELMEHALLRAEGVLSDRGALCVRTLPYSGITPGSYFCVDSQRPAKDGPAPAQDSAASPSESSAGSQPGPPRPAPPSGPWPVSRPGLQLAPLDESTFWAFYRRAVEYSEDKALYQCDGRFQGSCPGPAPSLRIIGELASQAIMARHWLGPWAAVDEENSAQHGAANDGDAEAPPAWTESGPELTVIALPGLKGEPWLEPLLETEVFVLIHPAQGLALVGGSRHGGDLRRAIAMLFAEVQAAGLLEANHPSVRSEAVGSVSAGLLCQEAVQVTTAAGRRSLFLGALGSGKQTLAAALGSVWTRGPLLGKAGGGLEQLRPLLAGGYGNVTDLDSEAPLQQRLCFGAVLENVPLQEASSRPRFGDLASAIPLWATWQDERWGPMSSGRPASREDVPPAIFLLVADVTGILPAIARLTRSQMLYYLALGYGAELPGWNRHQLAPAGHFSGDSRRTIPDILRWRDCLTAQGESAFYLVNTGWLGPMAGEARSLLQRIPVSVSETLVKAANAGAIPLHGSAPSAGKTCLDPVFGWTLPLGLQQLPGRWCQPWQVWGNARHWRAEAMALAAQYQAQMAPLIAAGLPPEIAQAGPSGLSDTISSSGAI